MLSLQSRSPAVRMTMIEIKESPAEGIERFRKIHIRYLDEDGIVGVLHFLSDCK